MVMVPLATHQAFVEVVGAVPWHPSCAMLVGVARFRPGAGWGDPAVLGLAGVVVPTPATG